MHLRLDKLLTEVAAGSRSEAKQWVRQGRVSIDGKRVARPEMKIAPDRQNVFLDGKLLSYRRYEYYMLNKPKGVVSATSDAKYEVVTALITESHRKDLFPVGRLDRDTEGLLIITNDGKLAHHLLSPKHHVDKTYLVKIQGLLTGEDVEQLEHGVDIGESKPTLPAVVKSCQRMEREVQTEVYLTIQEGKYHQVKRMFAALGKPVLALKRLEMGGLRLDEKLEPGEYRKLTAEEVEGLRNSTGKHKK